MLCFFILCRYCVRKSFFLIEWCRTEGYSMFFETILILLLTFFAAVGLMDISDWILRRNCRRNKNYRLFAVSDVSKIPLDDLEDHIRFLSLGNDCKEHTVILDLRNTEGEKLCLAAALSKRFGCLRFMSSKEAEELLSDYLQSTEKRL